MAYTIQQQWSLYCLLLCKSHDQHQQLYSCYSSPALLTSLVSMQIPNNYMVWRQSHHCLSTFSCKTQSNPQILCSSLIVLTRCIDSTCDCKAVYGMPLLVSHLITSKKLHPPEVGRICNVHYNKLRSKMWQKMISKQHFKNLCNPFYWSNLSLLFDLE